MTEDSMIARAFAGNVTNDRDSRSLWGETVSDAIKAAWLTRRARHLGVGQYLIPSDQVARMGEGNLMKGEAVLRSIVGRGVRLFNPAGNELAEIETGGLKPSLEHADKPLHWVEWLYDGADDQRYQVWGWRSGAWLTNDGMSWPQSDYMDNFRYLGPAEYVSAMPTEPGDHDYHGPVGPPDATGQRRAIPDPVHERFHGAVGDVLAGRVQPEARRQMQEALKAAPKDAPTTASTSRPMPGGAVRPVVPEKGVRI